MAGAEKKLRLDCVIVPKSSEDRIVGWLADALKIKLKAAPTDGKANAALLKLLAKELNLKPAEIAIASGHTSRRKTLVCEGIERLPAHLVQ
ncbi:MAG: DUF167 family protein [Gammaproteobacteria bacterium]